MYPPSSVVSILPVVFGKWSQNWLETQQGRQILQNSISWIMKKQNEKGR